MTTRLGDFYFIRMDPLPQAPAKTIAVEVRPGVDGESVWDEGNHGEMSMHLTMVDVPTVAGGVNLLAAYRAAIGKVLPVQWASQTLPFNVLILNVQPSGPGVTRVLGGVGGLNGAGSAKVEAVWTLLPTLAEVSE